MYNTIKSVSHWGQRQSLKRINSTSYPSSHEGFIEIFGVILDGLLWRVEKQYVQLTEVLLGEHTDA